MAKSDIKFSICIATWKPEGIARVAAMSLPFLTGVEYVVSWQCHENTPLPESLSMRDDLSVYRFDGNGLSANRNNALSHASGTIALSSDDDIIYNRDQLVEGLNRFDGDKDTKVAVYAYTGDDNPFYPSTECDLEKIPAGMTVTAFTLAQKRDGISDSWPVMFDTDFGPGAETGFEAAEDEMFLFTARHKGLRCKYYPYKICHHPGLSTGYGATPSAGVLKASGAYISREWPATAPLRILLKSFRLSRSTDVTFGFALRNLWRGMTRRK